MTSASEIAKMAFLVARATDSDQSAFDPDTLFKPEQMPPETLPVPESNVLSLAQQAFHKRKSDRVLNNLSLDLNQMNRICTAAYGYLKNGHRTVPSAGSYYPLQLHVGRIAKGRIQDVYLFDDKAHKLVKLHSVNLPIHDGFFVYGVDFDSASYVLLWSCRMTGVASKYGAKGYRFACFEIGHSAQMAVLECLSESIKHILLGGLNESWFQTNFVRGGRRLLPQYAMVM